MTEIRLTLTNRLGIHARPAAAIAKTASRFQSAITLHGNGKTIDAKSIIMVMSMGAKHGHELTIKADGQDEGECIQALRELVENKFYEE